MDISSKLNHIEKVLSLSPKKMAQIGGCSQATYYRYRNGVSVPDIGFVKNLVSFDSTINSDWILKDEGPVFVSKHSSEESKKELVTVPILELNFNKEVSEGAISVEEWQKRGDDLSISRELVEYARAVDTHNIFALKVQCDSMYPDIKTGSIALVDKSQNNINFDGIYIVKYNGVIRMKVVQKVPGEKVQLTTTNPRYKPIFIDQVELNSVDVLGRVVWVGTPY